MKKILLLSAFIVSFATSWGQVATVKAAIHTSITTATAYHSITPTIHGTLLEQLCDAVSLQGVADVGNVSTTELNIGAPPTDFLRLASNLVNIATLSENRVGMFVRTPGEIGTLYSEDAATSFEGRIQGGNLSGANNLTGDRNILIPDEGSGEGLNSTIVLHRTKNVIIVDGSYTGSNYDTASTTSFNSSGQTAWALQQFGLGGQLILRSLATNVTSRIRSTSTSNETFVFPDKSGAGGTIAMTSDITGYTPLTTYNSQAGTTYTLVAGDLGKVVTFSNSGAITLTVPSGLGATFYCTIQQIGVGIITPTASGTTLHAAHSYSTSNGQYTEFSIIFTPTADTYVMQGDMR